MVLNQLDVAQPINSFNISNVITYYIYLKNWSHTHYYIRTQIKKKIFFSQLAIHSVYIYK